jgi:DNA-directed RNA polymerase subunit beta
MQGRNETLNAIVKGQQIPKFGIPESFKVLLHELRSIKHRRFYVIILKMKSK